MSRSTFSGPVQAGVDDAIFYEKGTTGAKTGANWGFLKMAQSAPIQETTGQLFTGIVIPYSSVLTSVEVLVTTAWTGVNTYLDIGQALGVVPAAGEQGGVPMDANEFVSGLLVNALGNIKAGSSTTGRRRGLSCTTTFPSASTTVTTADTSLLTVGQLVTDDNNPAVPATIPLLTTVVSIDSPTTFTISAGALRAITVELDFIGLDADDIDSWMNVGSRAQSGASASGELIDRMIVYDTQGTSTGVGRGVLTVEYCQAVNLEAIA